jgi:2-oxoglutarate dehydrogenase E2 component (dihydrolipoamide succinyltransferase)
MSDFQIIMPKMGESVQEAVITKIFVNDGDLIDEDDVLFEIATDKVDSEIPSPVSGVVSEIKFKENDLVAVGEVVMLISIDVAPAHETVEKSINTLSNRFYSPLVKTIASKENISLSELELIQGSGENGRVQKKDILAFIEKRKELLTTETDSKGFIKTADKTERETVNYTHNDSEHTVVKMDRVRKIIADHMVMSKRTSPHVLSVVEADVTNIVLWRNRVKEEFLLKYGEKLTYLPIFIEACAVALTKFPGINASVDKDNIILKKHINIAIAVATNNGNLVVPVIKDVNKMSLLGITGETNRMAEKGRENKLSLDELQGGTFTITNFGSFGNLIGAPIINQPQVAILATGTIVKKPTVIETETGDVIAIRHKMYLSLSYDHRVIDGMYGGKFLKYISDILEQFDINQQI